MRDGSLINRIQEAQSAPDPTASADFDVLRVLRKRFSRGGLPAERKPADDARIVVFYVLKLLLELLGEFAQRIRRGERLRLVSREQPSIRGRMLIEIAIEPVSQQGEQES